MLSQLEEYIPIIILGIIALVILGVLRVIAFIIEMDNKKKKKKVKQDPFKGLPPAASTFTRNLAPAMREPSGIMAPVAPARTSCPACGWEGDDSDVFCGECGMKLVKKS